MMRAGKTAQAREYQRSATYRRARRREARHSLYLTLAAMMVAAAATMVAAAMIAVLLTACMGA